MKLENLIYLDWNLFSILKDPKRESHIVLSEFIENNRSKLTLAYSDAHLGDLSKSSDSDLITEDLEHLSKMTKDLLIVKYFGQDKVNVEFRNPIEFYQQNEYDNSTNPLLPFQSWVKQMTDTYGPIRDEIIKTHFKLDPITICNFSIDQIDELVRLIGIAGSLKELIEFGLDLRGNTSNSPLTFQDYYTTAYMNLDLIGFYPDTMNETSTFNNLLNDSKHSAYGAICKSFITNDNKCYYKSKFLFDYFECKSKLIKTCKIKGKMDILKTELNGLVA